MMRQTFNLADQQIGPDAPPFIIAEMSGNHDGSLDKALKLVDAAAASGAQAVKLQTYTADTMTIDAPQKDFLISDPESLWHNRRLYDLYEEAHTPWDWHKAIVDHARDKNILCFSSPFDESAVDFLEDLGMPCYKIASFENTHLPLIKYVAKTGKPLIISTGMATLSELEAAVGAAKDAGCKELILLKCTSAYPADPAQSNLATIPHLAEMFDCHVGLSDHTLGIGAAVAAVSLGAVAVEKHFTLDREDGGVDSAFSLNADELKTLVEETTRAWQSVGKIHYGRTITEEDSLAFRRSIYAVADIATGEALTADNIRIIRPGFGLPPSAFDQAIGKKARRNIKRGEALHWDILASE